MTKVYTLYDRLAETAVLPPFIAKNKVIAWRYVARAVPDVWEDGDHDLLCIGEFHEEPLKLVGYDKPEVIDVETISADRKSKSQKISI